MASDNPTRQYLQARWDALVKQRQPWLEKWREVTNYIAPFNGKYFINESRGSRDYDFILDDEATKNLNILVAGLSTGITPPARQWFKFKPSNEDAADNYQVQTWCQRTERLLTNTFQSSNTYNSLYMLYTELCLFGVGVDLLFDDDENVIRHHVLQAGEYCLQCNSDGEIDTLYRQFQLTAAQAVEMFGLDGLSTPLKDLYSRGKVDELFDFCHAIEPRKHRKVTGNGNKNMPFASYYFELKSDKDTILKESGFEIFPALCPRWNAFPNEPYGESPAMRVLPSVKQLQAEVDGKLKLIELASNPPLQAPMMASQNNLSIAPGAINFVPGGTGDQVIKPILNATGNIDSLVADIMELKRSIKEHFFVDLFLMIQQATSDRMTAAEVYALKEEKLMVLGPVLVRLQYELLSPLIGITYNKLLKKGKLNDIPEMVAHEPMEFEFQSMLAQSQRATDINSIDRLLSTIQASSASIPDIIDNINPDGLFKVYADRLAIDPLVFRDEGEVAEIRQQRAQAQQQAMQAEQAQAMGGTVNQLAQAQKAGADASLATQQLAEMGGNPAYAPI